MAGFDTLTDSRFYYRQCMLQLLVEHWSWELFCDDYDTIGLSFVEFIVSGDDIQAQLTAYMYPWSPLWSADETEEEEVDEQPVHEPCAGAA